MGGSSKLRAAILIISETAAKDPSTDKGIPALQEVFSKQGGEQWTADETEIVADNVFDIQRTITQWTDQVNPVNLVVTSGGTGFTRKDVTPEVRHVGCVGRATLAVTREQIACDLRAVMKLTWSI